MRKRWLLASFLLKGMTGVYWAINAATSRYGPQAPNGYSKDFAARIGAIRTDLDAFSEAEIAVLENHGYLLAEAGIKRHGPKLAAVAAPLKIPFLQWMDEKAAKAAIDGSHNRKLLGRGSKVGWC